MKPTHSADRYNFRLDNKLPVESHKPYNRPQWLMRWVFKTRSQYPLFRMQVKTKKNKSLSSLLIAALLLALVVVLSSCKGMKAWVQFKEMILGSGVVDEFAFEELLAGGTVSVWFAAWMSEADCKRMRVVAVARNFILMKLEWWWIQRLNASDSYGLVGWLESHKGEQES